MHIISCATCSVQFEAKTTRRMYCSQSCKDRAKFNRASLTCRICNEPMWVGSTSSKQGEAAHNKCLAAQHGNRNSYSRGCRCEQCTEANRTAHIAYRDRYKERNGVSIQSTHKRKFKDEHGYWPQRDRDWISHTNRQAIYERDEWHCYLCNEAIDSTLHYNDDMAASLDHVTPRSKGGTDEQSNLKAVHRACNSRKGNREIEAQKILSFTH